MALVSIPKELIDNYRKASAKRVAGADSDLERRGIENIVDDPGRAMIAMLTPYLKGDLLVLSTAYTYGDIEVEDRGDGYYRMDIPDRHLSSDLPSEFGTVSPQEKQPKSFSADVQDQLLNDLVAMTAPMVLEATGGDADKGRIFFERCARCFSDVLGHEVAVAPLMVRFPEVLKRASGLPAVMEAADRVSQRLDYDDKIGLASSLVEIGGVSAKRPDKGWLTMVIEACCFQLGVEWNQDTGALSIDPLGTLKKAAFDVAEKESARPRRRRFWRRG